MGWKLDRYGNEEEPAPPKDVGNLAYLIYFALGVGLLLPWNSSITAVDYFSYLYPDHHVDRVFTVAYILPCIFLLCFLTVYGQHYSSWVRINMGLVMSLISVIVLPAMDAGFIDSNRGGSTATYYATVGMLVLQGVADAITQGSLVGAVAKLPGRYMQAFASGTSASGVLVSICRILTKGAFAMNPRGLRLSGIVYFLVSAVFLTCCLLGFNLMHKLPVVNHYQKLEIQRLKLVLSVPEAEPLTRSEDVEGESNISDAKSPPSAIGMTSRRSTLGKDRYMHTVGRLKWLIFAMIFLYIVTLSIFPGFLGEDVQSAALGDWYPVLLLSSYNLFDLFGRLLALPEVCIPDKGSLLVGGAVARLLFVPLFYACLHGPRMLRSEVPVCVLTWLLGVSNGYLTTCLFVVATQSVPLAEAEAAGVIMTIALVGGLALGSAVSWVWIV